MNVWMTRYPGVRGAAGILGVLLVLSVLGGCGGKSDEVQGKAAEGGAQALLPQRVDTKEVEVDFAPPPERLTPLDEARKTIETYEQQVEAEPDNPETPARLMALANLHKQKLLDFQQAAVYYRQVITQFPDFEQLGLAYIQLSDCYELMEDWRSAQM
ncbi:MAG TPA: hypothetical protein PKL84_14965, partial [Candidatus Hydrogenedentes bacterium]|nr:hypothetical protein [Candidatus Hydrogenedentota bacterium]